MTTKTSTFATNDVVTANDLNAEYGPWNSYTPTLAQGTAANISKTVNYAKYRQTGKTAKLTVNLSATGAGASGTITVSLPVTAAAPPGTILGAAIINDYGTAIYAAIAVLASTTTVKFLRAESPSTAGNYFGLDPSMTIASGDQVHFGPLDLEVA